MKCSCKTANGNCLREAIIMGAGVWYCRYHWTKKEWEERVAKIREGCSCEKCLRLGEDDE